MTRKTRNRRKYPFLLKPRFSIRTHPALGPKFAAFMILLSFVMFWAVDGSVQSGAIAAGITGALCSLVLAPHVLAKARSTSLRSLATVIVGCIALAGAGAGILLLYVLVFVRPGTGDFRYYLSAMMLLNAVAFFWLSYAYVYQIYYHWKNPPGNDRP